MAKKKKTKNKSKSNTIKAVDSKIPKGQAAGGSGERKNKTGNAPLPEGKVSEKGKKKAGDRNLAGSRISAEGRVLAGSKASVKGRDPARDKGLAEGRKTAGSKALEEAGASARSKIPAGNRSPARKKGGGNARSRNPNLKLVKNEDGPVISSNAARSGTSLKDGPAGTDPGQGAFPKRTSAEEAFPRKAAPKKPAAKDRYPKIAPLEEAAVGKSSVGKRRAKRSSSKRTSLREVPERKDSPKRAASEESLERKGSKKKAASEEPLESKAFTKESPSEEVPAGKDFPKRGSTEKIPERKDFPEEGSAEETTARKNSRKRALFEEAPKKKKSKKRASLDEVSGKKTSEKRTFPEKASEKETYSKRGSGKEAYSKKSSAGKIRVKETYTEEDFTEEAFTPKHSRKKGAGGKASKKRAFKNRQEEDAYISGPVHHKERMGIGEWLIQHKSLVIIWFMVFAVIAGLITAYYYVITNYKVTTVYVDGNVHYTNEEIMDMVMNGPYGDNSLYLALKYKDRGVEDVPFVERMDVNILTPNMIRINVYEKALAGYVEYLGRYMYFDREGIVVESSQEKTDGIPQVTGLQFGYVILNEALPVEDDTIFKRILSITQLLDKYELAADRIYFDTAYNLTLYFEGVRVTLGADAEIDEKIMRLQYILPELAGKSGTLSMENYTEDTRSIPFHQD